MPQNLEVKARVKSISFAQALTRSIHATFIECLNQVDTYFCVEHGRLKLRETNQQRCELIYYDRPETTNHRLSHFMIYPCQNASSLKDLLGKALGVRNIVTKTRLLYMYDVTRIHLDDVQYLGSFLEFETPYEGSHEKARNVTDFLLARFEVQEADFIKSSYVDLMSRKNPGA